MNEAVSQVGCVYQFDPKRVKPFADQPRKRFRGISKLADSIRLIGQITPIVVTPCEEEGYERFRSIFAAVETCCHTLDRYLDMPGTRIKEMISMAPSKERKALSVMLESLCEKLLMFSDALVKS